MDTLNIHKSKEFIKSETKMNTNYNILDAYRQIIKNPLLNDFDMVKIALKEIQKKIDRKSVV